MRTPKPALTALMTTLYKRDPDLAHELPLRGGLRGLFDVHSAEYKSTTFDEKGAALQRLQRAGFAHVTALKQPFVEEMGAFGYHAVEAEEAFLDGLCTILDHLIAR